MEDTHPLPPMETLYMVLFCEDPSSPDQWVRIPSNEDLSSGTVPPVSLENGSRVEARGKFFEIHPSPAMTYLDDIGIPGMPLNVSFDGKMIPDGVIRTNNATTPLEPLGEHGNGTFNFTLDIDAHAGMHEIWVFFPGWPETGQQIFHQKLFRFVLYVNHPTFIDLDVTPATVKVGDVITLSGSVADDNGEGLSNVPLLVWVDDILLGPSSDGVYIDDVEVEGTLFSDDFEVGTTGNWSTYSMPGRASGDQWELGTPADGVGPSAPHSGHRLWGTVLDGDYQRGAWSFLVSPPVDLTAAATYSLSFYAWWSVYWTQDIAYVLASDDGGDNWDEENLFAITTMSLESGGWEYFELNVTRYAGSDDVRFAFVFFSSQKTLNAGVDSTFSYQYELPMDTTADRHNVTVAFDGNIIYAAGESTAFVDVQRITHFEFEANVSLKIGHRDEPFKVVAYLVDNMGEVLSTSIRGSTYIYQVTAFWDTTWTISDGVGDPVGTMAMDGGTGEASTDYKVPWDHTLGPANVTFRFPGDDYYTAAEGVDIYYVKAETYILTPLAEERIGFRGQSLLISADLRIVPEQSIDELEPGDPISGEFVKVLWGGNPIGHQRTQWSGTLSVDYFIPATHELGDVEVTFIYEGQSLFEPVTVTVTYTIVSTTSITMEDAVVHKGELIWINGTIEDDKLQGVEGLTINIFWGEERIGNVTSEEGGAFSLRYLVDYLSKVGNVLVIARFDGTKVYLPTEAAAVYSVKVGTVLVRWDGITSVVRGEEVQLRAKLFEDWGGTKGVEVQREEVILIIDGMVIDTRRTAFDGTVVYTVPINRDVFRTGEVEVVFEFEGMDLYDGSINVTRLLIEFTVHVSIPEIEVNGQPYDLTSEHLRRGDSVHGRLLVQDDNFQPLLGVEVSVYLVEPGGNRTLVARGVTDSMGFLEFDHIVNVPESGEVAFVVEVEGGPSTEYPFKYIVPPAPTEPIVFEVVGNRRVVVGKTLALEVRVLDPGGWNLANLTYSLVSPPGGMTISVGGAITWTPDKGHVGEHNVTVWLFDGPNSKASTFAVTVDEDDRSNQEEVDDGSLWWLVVLLVVAVVAGAIILYTRRGGFGAA